MFVACTTKCVAIASSLYNCIHIYIVAMSS